jgi:hypothetical protein
VGREKEYSPYACENVDNYGPLKTFQTLVLEIIILGIKK